MPRQLALTLLVLLTLLRPVSADIVHLKSGQRVEGEVTVKDGKVTIRTATGVVVQYQSEDVEKIERARSKRDEYKRKIDSTPKDDLRALHSLAGWTKVQRMRTELRSVCKLILDVDPNDDLARRELGYVVFENRWVLEDELQKQRRDKGLVKFRGEWMREAEKARRIRDEDRSKIANLMDSVRATNRYVQEYAVQQIMTLKLAHHRDIFIEYLDSEEEIVRVVAISALTNFRGAAFRGASRKKVIDSLFGRLVGKGAVPSRAEEKAIYLALRLIDPESAMGLALDLLRSSKSRDGARRHAIGVATQCLRKAWVPDVCRALVNKRGVEAPAVRELLVKIFSTDLGAKPQPWLDWWTQNAERFRDED